MSDLLTLRMKLRVHQQFAAYPAFPSVQWQIRHRLFIYGALALLIASMSFWASGQARAVEQSAEHQLLNDQAAISAAQTAAVQQWSMDTTELLIKATKLLDTPKRDIAVVMLEEAVRRDPASRDAALELGYAYFVSGDLTKAKVALEHARLLDPVYPVTYQLLAELYTKLGDMNQAAEATARATDFAKVPDLTK